MKKSTILVLGLLATAPVLITPLWWTVPVQIICCGVTVYMNAAANVERSAYVRYSLLYALLSAIILMLSTSLEWPFALLMSAGCHILGLVGAEHIMGVEDENRNKCDDRQEWIPTDDPRHKKPSDDIQRID